MAGLADSYDLSTEDDFDVLAPGDRDVVKTSRSAASRDLTFIDEVAASTDSLRVDLQEQNVPVPSPFEEVSVVNFGTMRPNPEDEAHQQHMSVASTSVYSPPSNIGEEPLEESASALAAFATSVSRDLHEDSANRRLIDELQRDNERLAAALAAAAERQKTDEKVFAKEKQLLEDELKAAKTELVLSQSVAKERSPRRRGLVDHSDEAERLKHELALAAERDDLRSELDALKLTHRDKHRQLAADLETARTALTKATEGRRAAELELEAISKHRGSSRLDILQESLASPLKSPAPPTHDSIADHFPRSPPDDHRRLTEARCRALETELDEERAHHERRIDALRMEFEALRLAHDKRIRELKEATTVQQKPSSDSSRQQHHEVNELRRTIRELEGKIEAVRHFYTSKLDAEQKKHDAALDAALKKATAASKKAAALAASKLTNSTEHNENTLISGAPSPSSRGPGVASPRDLVFNTGKSSSSFDHQQQPPAQMIKPFQVKALEIEVQRLTEVNRRLEEDKAAEVSKGHAATSATALTAQKLSEAEAKVAEAERRILDLEAVADRASKDRDAVEKAKDLADRDAARDLARLREKLAQAQADAVAAADEAIEARRRADIAETPHQVAVAALAKQVDDLQAKLKDRQRDVEAAVHDAKAAARIELARVQARHTDHLAAKDSQLQRFRFELDKLLNALRIELSNRHHSSSASSAAAAAVVSSSYDYPHPSRDDDNPFDDDNNGRNDRPHHGLAQSYDLPPPKPPSTRAPSGYRLPPPRSV